MKSHKEPLKYVPFVNTELIEIMPTMSLFNRFIYSMLNVKLLNRNIKTFQTCQTTASIHSSYENV